MKNIIMSIRYENNFSLVCANNNLSSVEFSTSYKNLFVLLFLVRYKLIKEKFKPANRSVHLTENKV